ncbi:MAG: YadA C-terminal domain-containing protein [Pseudomonadota bacterium]
MARACWRTEITTLQVGVDANTSAIEANTSTIEANTLALSTAQTALTASEKEIAHNASQIDVNAADIALLNAGVTGDGGRFIELENNVVDQGNRMNVVETSVTNNTTALTTLSGTVNANQQRIAHSEQSIADNTQAISVMQTQFEQLEFNVNSVALQLARTQEEIQENTAGIAISNALSGSTWLQSDEQIAFSANLGYYDGSSAVAFSGAARMSKHISANLAIGLVPSRGDIGARAGVRVGW